MPTRETGRIRCRRADYRRHFTQVANPLGTWPKHSLRPEGVESRSVERSSIARLLRWAGVGCSGSSVASSRAGTCSLACWLLSLRYQRNEATPAHNASTIQPAVGLGHRFLATRYERNAQ